MTYKKDGPSHLLEFFKLTITICLKKDISYRKCLIYDQDLRINVDRHGKSQTDKHTTGICLDRLMNKITDVRKIQNILQACIYLLSGKSHHGSIEIDIFNSGIFHIKSGSKFQKRRNTSIYHNFAAGWIQYTGDDLKNCGFTGTIGSDNSHSLSSFYFKTHIPQCIMLPHRNLKSQCLLQTV